MLRRTSTVVPRVTDICLPSSALVATNVPLVRGEPAGRMVVVARGLTELPGRPVDVAGEPKLVDDWPALFDATDGALVATDGAVVPGRALVPQPPAVITAATNHTRNCLPDQKGTTLA